MTDHAVNEWTRDDLPGVHWPGIHGESERQGAEKALDAVVEHLNAHHPKPSGPFAVMLEGTHRAQRERDAAVARADQLRDERDDAVQSCMAVGRERDEWKARAEAAEARTAVTREDVEKAVRRGHNMFNAEVGVVNEMCDLFGIEDGQATDPLLDKALEFAALADWELTDREAELLHTVARHVLGQEAKR